MHHRAVTDVGLATGLTFFAVFATTLFLFMNIGHAAVSSNVAASLMTANQTIKASSTATAVFGLNLAGDQTLASTTISFVFQHSAQQRISPR